MLGTSQSMRFARSCVAMDPVLGSYICRRDFGTRQRETVGRFSPSMKVIFTEAK